ncbi:helix-turn-helix transcriptional regulator [Streptomyces longwoodensis]|uniref:helix-turn-helix domain-containing protein n=1 Tax=Streptomyces longwoodensis TaxID=68231 RepID=UPI002258BF33|nr:helix-turn-helix transcriptional regulator [Streptomyces longwoodensis]MCX4997351.1 helix-turn-helix transcriptional regulator [Streptomyces longwoodensis]WRY91981.1 helix-turn-helix transcriptional regulator [Streptomyces longwoodensis]WUC70030.1 helix-turn-helix transcriptional regulator [Streptomyces longwoodensis]
MGRPQKPIVQDGSPVRLFAFWLRNLRDSAGFTLEQLARRAEYGRTTVSDAMGGEKLPSRPVTLAIVGACKGDVRRWSEYWAQVRRALDPDCPDGVAGIDPPPWDPPGRPAGLHAEQCPPDCTRTDPHGWYTESVATLLRLDTPTPEALERRTVVTTCEGLTRIPVGVSVPRRAGDTRTEHGLEISVVRGGRLEDGGPEYESYFERFLVPPDPLRAGTRHTYEVRLRIPPAQPMAPHFVHVPLTRSEHFRLRVRFDRARMPRRVWRLAGVPTAVIYQQNPGTPSLEPDGRGVVDVGFAAMKVGYGYGLSWLEAGVADQ